MPPIPARQAARHDHLRSSAMNHFANLDMIRIHQAEQRRAADRHRLGIEALRAGRPRRAASLRDLLSRLAPQRIRGVAEVGPCPR